MNLRDIKIVLRAVECLYHGLDISNYTYEDLKSTYFNDKGAKVSKAVANLLASCCNKLQKSSLD